MKSLTIKQQEALDRRVLKNRPRVIKLLLANKFLADKKYYKNNYWSTAAWDSWAAKGQAGSCRCGCGYYNISLANKRASTYSCKYVIEKICYECFLIIENSIQYKFPRH